MFEHLTSEVARPGHPDKLADRVADAILDQCLAQDPSSRVAVDCLLKGSTAVVAGEISTKANLDIAGAVRRICGPDIMLVSRLSRQDPQLAVAVAGGGAGDSGLMFGMASVEMLPVERCRRVVEALDGIPGLLPDGKVSLTGQYGPAVICVQHEPGAEAALDAVRRLPELAGRQLHLRGFIEGGAEWDCGMTGRKTASDSYGGACPHGGGAFSGKDGTKVDRSAAYAARYVARRLLKQMGARLVVIQVAYALGHAKPVAFRIEVDGRVFDHCPLEFDWRPLAIIERFDLRSPRFEDLATHSHFFRTELPWEAA